MAEVTVERSSEPASQDATRMADQRRLIGDALQHDIDDLIVAARIYVKRFHIAAPNERMEAVVDEILLDLAIRAFEISDEFDPSRPAHPWLRGLLFNIVREERRRRWTERQRTSSIIDTGTGAGNVNEVTAFGPTEADLFDRLRGLPGELDPASAIHADDLLALVAEQDREILRLAFIEDLDRQELAARLGITVGAAYTRLSRALSRLRAAYARSAYEGPSGSE